MVFFFFFFSFSSFFSAGLASKHAYKFPTTRICSLLSKDPERLTCISLATALPTSFRLGQGRSVDKKRRSAPAYLSPSRSVPILLQRQQRNVSSLSRPSYPRLTNIFNLFRRSETEKQVVTKLSALPIFVTLSGRHYIYTSYPQKPPLKGGKNLITKKAARAALVLRISNGAFGY